MSLLSNSYIALFVIITLGYLLGRIKIAGMSLDASAVIFVALFFGYCGIMIPTDFQYFGLLLFIFTVGLQAGPGFFESFKKDGRSLAVIAAFLVTTGGLITALVCSLFGIDKNIAIGLMTGALTSSPGLAAAIDCTQSPLVSIGYGVAYPFGVIGIIIFVKMMPWMLRKKVKTAEEEYARELLREYPEIHWKNFVVENQNVIGKSIGELKIRDMTQAVVSRVVHDGVAITPSPETILHRGDLIKAVGTTDSLNRVMLFIGPETDIEVPLDPQYDVRTVLVTNKDVVNKSLGRINLLATYGATITRIRRSGIDISPSPDSKVLLGDKLIIAASKTNMAIVTKIFGDDDKHLSDTDIFPVALGIVLGGVAGLISLSIGDIRFSIGLTGGVLIVSMVLSRIGRTGPIVWTMTGGANNLIRQIGLLLFLSAVGTHAGSEIVSTFNTYGINLFVYGVFITLIPLFVALFVGKWLFKMNILTLFGAITGGKTCTPGLAAANSMTDSNAPSIAYATVYPLAMVLMITVVQLLNLFLP